MLKSIDRGNNWFSIFDEQASLTIGDIALDPQDPDIIYVGTGEANGGHNNFPGVGMFKSTDAGLTWTHIGLDSTASIGRIVIDPFNTQRVFVAAVGSYFTPTPQRGVYYSSNGGTNWDLSLSISDSTGAIDLIMDPTDPDFMMVAMWERVRRTTSNHLYGPSSGIYRTFDGGTTWTKLDETNGLPSSDFYYGTNDGEGMGRIGLAMCTSQPNITYALINDGVSLIGLYRTNDYGTTWIKADPDNLLDNAGFSFSWYFGQVRVRPDNPDVIFVLDISLFRSEDGGLTWPICYGYSGPYSNILHVDHHALAFNPLNPDYIISGNDGGINTSTNGGTDWSNHANIPVTQFYEIGLDYHNPERLYGGSQDNETVRTSDGDIDDWVSIYGGDGFYVLVDFEDPTIMYAESQNGGLVKLTEGANNNFQITSATNGLPASSSELRNWSMPVVFDPNNSSVLYLGTNRIYRSIDKAGFWEPISLDLTNGPYTTSFGTVTTIAVAPSDTNVIYAGTDDSNIWVTNDYGMNWQKISDGLPQRWVTRVVVDPSDASIVYATFSGLKWRDPQSHVFKSTNMGQTWTDISSNLPDAPVNAFAVDLNDHDRLYLGNDVGAYVSGNGGESWEMLGDGIPIVPISDMKIHPTENYLAVGTYGRSMYKINIADITGVEDNSESVPNNFALYQNYPNPFNPTTTISFELDQTQHIELKIYNLLGEVVATPVNSTMPRGNHSILFDASRLSSGVYIYQLTGKNLSSVKKMAFVK